MIVPAHRSIADCICPDTLPGRCPAHSTLVRTSGYPPALSGIPAKPFRMAGSPSARTMHYVGFDQPLAITATTADIFKVAPKMQNGHHTVDAPGKYGIIRRCIGREQCPSYSSKSPLHILPQPCPPPADSQAAKHCQRKHHQTNSQHKLVERNADPDGT